MRAPRRRGSHPDCRCLPIQIAALHKLPQLLQTALDALYGHYAKTFALWEEAGTVVPPVFIVVCNNTAASKLVYDYISGFRADEDAPITPGHFELFRNYDDYGNRLPRPRTLLIDSEQLESGEALDKGFRDMAADEIERFRREIVARTGDIRAGEKLTDQDLLREVMNTVGKAQPTTRRANRSMTTARYSQPSRVQT